MVAFFFQFLAALLFVLALTGVICLVLAVLGIAYDCYVWVKHRLRRSM